MVVADKSLNPVFYAMRRRIQSSHLLTVLLLLLMLTACNPSENGKNGDKPPPTVSVAHPLVRQITDWDEYTGRFAAVENVEVRARVSGYLQSIHFDEGLMVEKGQLLYVIDPRPFQAALDESAANRERATAQLALARNDFARAERLFRTKTISEEELDNRTQALRAAQAALDAANAALDAARLDLEFTEVRAPIAGRIGRTRVTVGNLVNGGSADATLLTTVVSLDPIHLYFTAAESAYLRYMRLDQADVRPSSRLVANPVRIRLGDEQEFVHEGVMDFIDNRIDEATGTMLGRAIFPNPDGLLLPGMFARVQLLGEGPYRAVLLPATAIATDQAQKFVYTLADNQQVSRRNVVTGRMVGDGLQVIREGLGGDETIVINGLQRVRLGQTVNAEFINLEDTVDLAAKPE